MKTVVIDTNDFVSALRSRRGASFKLLSLVGTGRFDVVVSVPLVVEYEYALSKTAQKLDLVSGVVGDILDYVCRVAKHQDIWFLWRPILSDPRDDMLLEVGMASEAEAIITYNKRDFREAESFDIQIMTPKEFLLDEGLL
ncbi:MAG: putative toxin-antitoxin system toxin component, PIN family [Rhodothermales bacterium]|nr:putative toxin-antitoxin system toxin component, PIN family [Rhodothermales bacterium]